MGDSPNTKTIQTSDKCREIAGPLAQIPTNLRRSEVEELVFRPFFEATGPNRLDLIAYRDDDSTIPWGLWGGLLAIAAGIALIVREGAYGFHSVWTITAALAIVAIGVLSAKFGTRSSRLPVHLGRVDLQSGVFWIPNTDGESPIRLDSVTEVVYAMVKYPLTRRDTRTRIDAFTVLVRTGAELVPIIEASPDKNQVFAIAKTLGQWTGLEPTYVGIGVK